MISSFGGISVYNAKEVLKSKCRYAVRTDKGSASEDCEHVAFHHCLQRYWSDQRRKHEQQQQQQQQQEQQQQHQNHERGQSVSLAVVVADGESTISQPRHFFFHVLSLSLSLLSFPFNLVSLFALLLFSLSPPPTYKWTLDFIGSNRTRA